MGTKKKQIEPKSEIKKDPDRKDAKATKRAERKTQRYNFSDAEIKHTVKRLG